MIMGLRELIYAVDSLVNEWDVFGMTDKQFNESKVMIARSVQADGKVKLDCGLLIPKC